MEVWWTKYRPRTAADCGRSSPAKDGRRFLPRWSRALGHEECNAAINAELRQHVDLTEACRALDVPVSIVDGSEDIRPRSAVDPLEDALPDVRRVTVAGAGHLPWVEQPDLVQKAITSFLCVS